ncbi:MAG TPA: tRNA (guanosine(46)-N7)-methyltransferase TrmB [Cytophagales bacterium]|nr:tRNA (guanosine(46)-N7)-methyltransferase TrmB [Cytophagales bacterium]
MARQKQKKFAQVAERPNVVQPGKPIFETIKGNWHQEFFKNDNPITLELACGRGEYTVGLARIFSERNYIGIDVKGDRIWKGSGIALYEGLTNAGFLRIRILDIEQFFQEGEVDEIWITFPDPRPRDRDEKRRLTYSRFLDIYKRLLRPGRTMHLKTDNTGLFDYTVDEVFPSRKDIQVNILTRDLYHSEYMHLHHGIRTRYEAKFHDEAGEDIKYVQWQFLPEAEVQSTRTGETD